VGQLSDAFTDLFLLTSYLKSTKEYGNAESLHNRIIGIFESAEQNGKGSGCSGEALNQARFALAALIDETIMGSSWSGKDDWSSRTLQYEFFKENVAGIEFFNRLETIRRSSTPDPDLLELFYLCLVFGFEGQYKFQNREKLKELVDEIAKQIKMKSALTPHLSPHGKRPDELIEVVRREIPSWVVIVTTVFIIFFFYMVLSLMISSSANKALANLKQLLEGPR